MEHGEPRVCLFKAQMFGLESVHRGVDAPTTAAVDLGQVRANMVV
jgi:hypothetical protein